MGVIAAPQEETGSQIVTYTGRAVDPLDMKPEDLHILDIAHSLSLQCRFTGHVRKFYSVAQHSVLCAELALERHMALVDPLALLLHDASEAYLSDIARPVKRAVGFGERYGEVEDGIQAVVAKAWGLEYPFPPLIHMVDETLLRAEQRDLMRPFPDGPEYPEPPLSYPQRIEPLSPAEAELQFLRTYHKLWPRRR